MEKLVLSVANEKGGIGKSLITVLLATALAQTDNKKVLVIDADEQQSINNWRKLEQNHYETKPPYEVISERSKYIADFFRNGKDKDYEVIFIDIPRMTNKDESATALALSFCDAFLIPVTSGNFDTLSTINFHNTAIKEIKNFRESKDYEFICYGFQNKRTQRSEEKEVIPYMRENGLQMFDNYLSDLKMFTEASTYDSILNEKQAQERFKPFYDEFKTKFNIK